MMHSHSCIIIVFMFYSLVSVQTLNVYFIALYLLASVDLN